jgi:small subunit ribosomal protein S16
VAVKIKLKRFGKTRNAQYRIVVADARTARDGRAIEEIGLYQPKQEPSLIQVNSDRAQYWLGVGAQPTEAVTVLLKITGDWQKFKGLPGTEGTLRVAPPKPDKRAIFEAAVKQAADEPTAEATTPRKKAEKAEAAADAAATSAAAVDVDAVSAAEQVQAESTVDAAHHAASAQAEAAPADDAPAENTSAQTANADADTASEPAESAEQDASS